MRKGSFLFSLLTFTLTTTKVCLSWLARSGSRSRKWFISWHQLHHSPPTSSSTFLPSLFALAVAAARSCAGSRLSSYTWL
ncbi:hypothetical protein D3C86_1787010 [compost metagenome]